jgi:ABC-type amino acid transport substrate-binding protein
MRTLAKILGTIIVLTAITLLILWQLVKPCSHCDAVTISSAAANAGSATQSTSPRRTPAAGVKKLRIFYPGADQEPYFLPTANGQAGGIIEALLQPFLQSHQYQLVLVNVPRARVHDHLYNGNLDLAMGNPHWYELSDQLHFSRPLIRYTDYIFQRADSGALLSQWQELSGERVCTHLNYQYQQIDEMAAKNLITLVPSGSSTLMLRMFLAGRCDYLIGERHVITYLSQQEGVSEHIKPSLLTDDNWAAGLSAAPNQKHFIDQLNQYLSSPQYHQHQQLVRERWKIAPAPKHY